MIAIILLVVILLGGGGFAYWKFVYLPNTPLQVVRNCIAASLSGDKESLKKYFTQASRAGFDLNLVEGPAGSSEFKEGTDYTLELASSDSSTAKVICKFPPAGLEKVVAAQGSQLAGLPGANPEKLNLLMREIFKDGATILLAKEDGKWKVDGPQTESALTGAFLAAAIKLSPGLRSRLGPGVGTPGAPPMPGVPGMQPKKNQKPGG